MSHLIQEDYLLQVFASTTITCRKFPIQRNGEGLPCTSTGLKENKAVRSLWWAALALAESNFWYSVELDSEVLVTYCAQGIGVVGSFAPFGYEHHEWQQYVCLLGSCLHRMLWYIVYMPGACYPPVLLPQLNGNGKHQCVIVLGASANGHLKCRKVINGPWNVTCLLFSEKLSCLQPYD